MLYFLRCTFNAEAKETPPPVGELPTFVHRSAAFVLLPGYGHMVGCCLGHLFNSVVAEMGFSRLSHSPPPVL